MTFKSLLSMSILAAAASMVSTSAMALECAGLTVPDNFAKAVINAEVQGFSYKISDRKRLVVNGVDAVSGSNCNLRATLDVTLKRKIRRDAHGTVVVKGTLAVRDNKICVVNPSVADVDLSNTLNIGEGVYKLVANKALPKNLCF